MKRKPKEKWVPYDEPEQFGHFLIKDDIKYYVLENAQNGDFVFAVELVGVHSKFTSCTYGAREECLQALLKSAVPIIQALKALHLELRV